MLTDLRNQLTRTGFRALNSVVVPLVERGFGSPLPVGPGVVLIETTGRKSGLPRRVPLLGVRAGSKVVVSTVRSSSQWLANLEADENAGVTLCGRRRGARGSVQRGTLNVAVFDTAAAA